MLRSFLALTLTAVFSGAPPSALAARYDGRLTLSVLDQQSRQPIAARLQLRDSRGRPVKVRPEGAAGHGDYFVFEGVVMLELRQGQYQFLLEAGPEYHTRLGRFTIQRHAEDSTEVMLQRHVDMQNEGWWAGDLDVRQKPKDMPLMMRAGGVDIAPLLTRENNRGKCRRQAVAANVLGSPRLSLDYRRGGGLLLLTKGQGGSRFDVCTLQKEDSSMALLTGADEAEAVVALTPFAWDLPLWVASGKLDAVQVIHRHALRDGVVDNEGWGRPRDKTIFPGNMGNGRWSETIYHHLLNCGLRIPPAAGSGSGANGNPVGANRVYVQCEEFSTDNWLAGMRAGRVMISNGPLLRTEVEGQGPGYVFHIDSGASRNFQIGLSLSFYEEAPVEYLEIIKNGRIEHAVRLDELARKKGRLPAFEFDASGWFLVRAITSRTQNYQFASTGPYYVESGYQPRISRASVEFFLNWLDEAAEKFADNRAVLADIEAARPFWKDLLLRANAD
ncbi:MAG: hypothetical protein MI725_09165 [Pirellulales bacterium]|nr:hypothetical protein [Pirellulales bacterium]